MCLFFFQAEKKSVSFRQSQGCFDYFFLSRLAMWVGTHHSFQALTTAYLANQKPFQIATLDIFVAMMNGVMESMWCGLQTSTWTISSSETKRLWSKLIATKTKQRSLFVRVCIVNILGHIWPSVSWNCCWQPYKRGAIGHTIICTWIWFLIPVELRWIVCLLYIFKERWSSSGLLSLFSAALFYHVCVMPKHGPQVLSSAFNTSLEGSQGALMPLHTGLFTIWAENDRNATCNSRGQTVTA